MGAPIQLSGLPQASVVNDADQTLLRQGLSDFRATIGDIRNINIPGLTQLPSAALASDQFMISRASNNYRVSFNAVGLPIGTKTWVYMSSANVTATMIGWKIVPNTGDSLLSVGGGATYSTGGTTQGTWTQPAIKLLIGQIPAHQHGYQVNSQDISGTSATKVLGAKDGSSVSRVMKTYHTGGVGSAIGSSNPDAYQSPYTDSFSTDTDPVQADATWRPFASVGFIIEKIV